MTSLWSKVEPILLDVRQPSQYIGGEVNSIVKDHAKVGLKVALAFPDTYRIGMSHHGLQILYGVLNEPASPAGLPARQAGKRLDILAERTFTPWPDMEAVMRREGIPLFTLETHTPVKDFDVVGFSLQQELCYTNLLNMLDLAGIPLLSRDRVMTDPIILAGGPCVFNPEPLADFVDLFLLGDGEERVVQLAEELLRIKHSGLTDRKEIIKSLVKQVPNLYAPAWYEVTYNSDGTVAAVRPTEPGIPKTVTKAVVEDLDKAYYPVKPIVPFAEPVHDRINLEIMRGCPQACRFCISNVIKTPLRFRSVQNLVDLAERIYANTGYDEISLLSLSSGDYPWLDELLVRLSGRFKGRRVGLALPSLHINEKIKNLPSVINAVRKTGFTLAPETGRDGLRQIINKPIDDKEFFEAVRAAYQNGWHRVKLYFMIGLPGETEEDIQAITKMIRQASSLGKEIKGSPGNINVTISPFTAKPHTPFQWVANESIDRLKAKQNLIRQQVKSRRVKLKFHNPERSYLESVFARGDRRLGKVLLEAWRVGCKFDAWDELFDFRKWLGAFKQAGVDPDFYVLRERDVKEILPWSHLETGISLDTLRQDWLEAREMIVRQALRSETTNTHR